MTRLAAEPAAPGASRPPGRPEPRVPDLARPPRLRPGDTVAVCAPAAAVHHRSRLSRGVRQLADLGFDVALGPAVIERDLERRRPADRAAELDALFRDPSVRAVVAAVGGLLRDHRGPQRPLFRERYIWPAVQVTHLVPSGHALDALAAHQQLLERLLGRIGLPVVGVRVHTPLDYGDPCYLSVSCLTAGLPCCRRPTGWPPATVRLSG